MKMTCDAGARTTTDIKADVESLGGVDLAQYLFTPAGPLDDFFQLSRLCVNELRDVSPQDYHEVSGCIGESVEDQKGVRTMGKNEMRRVLVRTLLKNPAEDTFVLA